MTELATEIRKAVIERGLHPMAPPSSRSIPSTGRLPAAHRTASRRAGGRRLCLLRSSPACS
jgi:hypothetical protein